MSWPWPSWRGWGPPRRNREQNAQATLAALICGLGTAGLWATVAWLGPSYARRAQASVAHIDFTVAMNPTSAAFWLPVAFAVAGGTALVAYSRCPHWRWGGALLACLVGELLTFGAHQGRIAECPHVPATLATSPRFEMDWRGGRILPVAYWDFPFNEDYAYLRTLQYPSLSYLDRLPSVKGYDAFIFSRYQELLKTGSGGNMAAAALIGNPAHHGLDITATRTLRLDARLLGTPAWREALRRAPHWQQLRREPDVVVFENQRALPRAWRPQQGTQGTWETIRARIEADPAFDPRREALLEDISGHTLLTPGTAEIEDLSLNTRRLTTWGTGPGLAVVSESYDPGWRAWSGTTELPVRRVDGLLLGVEVPAGPVEVILRYEPQRWRAGLAASGGALVLLVGWGLAKRRRRRPV